MSDLSSICGQVQGLAPKLLQRSHIDRMVGAPDAEAAFSILTELQYADYIDQQTSITDFDGIISQGLFETKTLIASGTQETVIDLFLTLPFDINNLKHALKQRLIEEKSEFETDSSFSKLGHLTPLQIQKIVFDGIPAGTLPATVLTTVFEVVQNFAKESSVRDIEFALDNVLFSTLGAELAEEVYPSYDLAAYLALWADSVQIRNLARSILVMQEALPESAFIKTSGVSFEVAGKAETFADFKKVLEKTQFSRLATLFDEGAATSEQLLQLERYLDKALQDFLHNSALGSLDSPIILIDYFSKRLHNARVLKLVMYGKLNGLEPDKIYKLIESV